MKLVSTILKEYNFNQMQQKIIPAHNSKIIKSRHRVKNQGEVFTQDREVKNILALTQATDNIFWRFLEPACGNGNFLVEIVNQRIDKIIQDPNKQ